MPVSLSKVDKEADILFTFLVNVFIYDSAYYYNCNQERERVT